MYVFVSLFFFFQAEDGIRDTSVTGVQTCALPISFLTARSSSKRTGISRSTHCCSGSIPPRVASSVWHQRRRAAFRSEERRVGKECRTRWLADHEKKNSRRA